MSWLYGPPKVISRDNAITTLGKYTEVCPHASGSSWTTLPRTLVPSFPLAQLNKHYRTDHVLVEKGHHSGRKRRCGKELVGGKRGLWTICKRGTISSVGVFGEVRAITEFLHSVLDSDEDLCKMSANGTVKRPAESAPLHSPPCNRNHSAANGFVASSPTCLATGALAPSPIHAPSSTCPAAVFRHHRIPPEEQRRPPSHSVPAPTPSSTRPTRPAVVFLHQWPQSWFSCIVAYPSCWNVMKGVESLEWFGHGLDMVWTVEGGLGDHSGRRAAAPSI